MYTRTRRFALFALAAGLGFANPSHAAQNRSVVALSETSEQPTDEIREVIPATAGELRLQDHRVDVVINNGFATTTVEQLLVNAGERDIDAQWSFPLPKDACLSELALWIDGKATIGEVVPKPRAREIYEQEQSAGQDAALAEQNGFRDYTISLTRVPAGGEARVRIVYFQPLEIDAGVGRYLYPLTPGHTHDGGMDGSFWTLDKQLTGQFTIEVTLKTSFPVDGLHSPTHQHFQAESLTEGEWRGSAVSNRARLDEDFLLFYRLAPDVPARVELLTSREPGAAEGTFMAVVTPGSDLAPITEGTDWIYLIDVSGSMHGEKLRMVRRGLSHALRAMGPNDRFRLIQFNGSAQGLTTGWWDVNDGNRATADALIEKLNANGGTNLFGALEHAYKRLDADRSCAIVLLSDGAANVGPHEYRDFVKLARANDVRLFTFVIGNGANEQLLGDLADLSGGYAKSVSVRDEIGAHLMLAFDRMSHEAMHNVRFELPGAVDLHPKQLPSLYLGQQLVVFGRYETSGPRTLQVSARISGVDHTWSVPIVLPEVDLTNPELERLHALETIADMQRAEWLGERTEDELREGIVDVAVRYSLVTDYTSMIVVRDDRRDLHGLGRSNEERRAREVRAADGRAMEGPSVSVVQGQDPLGGNRAAHAPTRSGGGVGLGAVGPWFLVVIALLGLVVARGADERRRAASASGTGQGRA